MNDTFFVIYYFLLKISFYKAQISLSYLIREGSIESGISELKNDLTACSTFLGRILTWTTCHFGGLAESLEDDLLLATNFH